MLVHTLALVVMALITLAPIEKIVNILNVSNVTNEAEEVQEFELQDAKLSEVLSQEMELPENPVEAVETLESPQPTPVQALSVSAPPTPIAELVDQVRSQTSLAQSLSAMMPTGLSSRSGATRGQLLRKYGGNAASEKAVAMALKWLSIHQRRDGSWTFAHPTVCGGQCDHPGTSDQAVNAATALGILPFLGAGQTHLAGEYREVVSRGLLYLVNKQQREGRRDPRGSWHEPQGTMYSHGLASIAICEAYAMTEDPALREPAQAALNFIVFAQSPTRGGWRYANVPADDSDTSIVGWQMMALKSGHMGHLIIPPRSILAANRFLDSVQANGGAFYGYDKPTTNIDGAISCNVIGLLCRMYSGWDRDHPAIREGVQWVAAHGPEAKDPYFNYYASQVLRHYGGPEWDAFNTRLRDQLVSTQVASGHAAGSWSYVGPDVPSHRGPVEGGRLCITALNTMTLEVYYRHLPLYAETTMEDDFPL
jgi:hypothetical protein